MRVGLLLPLYAGQAGAMFGFVLLMLVCLIVAMAVVGVVAVPARRDGRDVLTERGEAVIDGMLDKVKDTASAAGSAAGRVAGRR